VIQAQSRRCVLNRAENDTIGLLRAMTAPSQIAHYKVTGKLGEGGIGAAYRAADARLSIAT
jgi:hypothetical protein